MTRIYVPCDSSALALGADAVAAAIASEAAQRGVEVQIVRNGSRGLCGSNRSSKWRRRKAASAIRMSRSNDLAALFDAGFIEGGAHAEKRRRRR